MKTGGTYYEKRRCLIRKEEMLTRKEEVPNNK